MFRKTLSATAIAFGACALGGSPSAHVIAVAPRTNLIQNGGFGAGLTGWSTFALPTPGDLVANANNGVLEFYRKVPPPGEPSQAVVLQATNIAFPNGAPVDASFDLGNSSSVRKRVGVLIHDFDFSDLAVCTFWLAPHAALATYTMRAFTTKVWDNATISFYAATAGDDGGFYQVDNVTLQSTPGQLTDRIDCVDPTVPTSTSGVSTGNLLTNFNFGTGTTEGWTLFGQIVGQMGSFPAPPPWQFPIWYLRAYRPAATPDPAGVLLQPTSTTVLAGDRVTATIALGNGSSTRKRVTLIVHDLDFTDLVACSFWAPSSWRRFQLTGVATRPWANLTFSLYAATPGDETGVLLLNASVLKGDDPTVTGTQCRDIGAVSFPSGGEPAAGTAALSSANGNKN